MSEKTGDDGLDTGGCRAANELEDCEACSQALRHLRLHARMGCDSHSTVGLASTSTRGVTEDGTNRAPACVLRDTTYNIMQSYVTRRSWPWTMPFRSLSLALDE
jgi:hypothetical protein